MQITVTLSNPELQQELSDFIADTKKLGDFLTPEMFTLDALETALADRRLDRVNAEKAEANAKAQMELY